MVKSSSQPVINPFDLSNIKKSSQAKALYNIVEKLNSIDKESKEATSTPKVISSVASITSNNLKSILNDKLRADTMSLSNWPDFNVKFPSLKRQKTKKKAFTRRGPKKPRLPKVNLRSPEEFNEEQILNYELWNAEMEQEFRQQLEKERENHASKRIKIHERLVKALR
eukprot:CAMPEP_0196996906 /NCGR_PEP_ID=MMETSP1380-20130617/2682_1 /TAXON_ID=5936 /ORGANISM="Euplotes crassus, Strain CT5" /LENGTH=167 /DNA_ID=CAMNT_0042413021 /DNA_START=244 /DNA_END=743 /DNA_ORIENTATION=+